MHIIRNASLRLFLIPAFLLLTACHASALEAGAVSLIPAAASFDAWLSSAVRQEPTGADFVALYGGNSPGGAITEFATRIHAVWLPEGIGLLIQCDEPDRITANVAADDRNARRLLDEDDFVEVFIDPNRDGQKAFGVAINPNGAHVDGLYFARDWADATWKSEAQIQTGRIEGGWAVALVIPFSTLGVRPAPGDIIGLGVSRIRRVGAKDRPSYAQQGTAWPRGQSYFTWHQRRRLLDPWFFAPVQTVVKKGDGLLVRSSTRGSLSSMPDALNVFVGQVMNTGTTARKVRLEIRSGGPRTARTDIEIQPGQMQPIALEYEPGEDRTEFRLLDEKSGQVLYESHALRTFDLPQRIHDLGGAYREDLVDRVAPPPRGIAHLTFPQPLDEGKWTEQLLAYALPYSLEGVAQEMGEHHIAPHTTIRTDLKYNNLPDQADLLRRHGVSVVFTPGYHLPAENRPGGMAAASYLVDMSRDGKSGTKPFHFRPLPSEAFKADYMDALDEGLDRFGDLIFAVFIADELDYLFSKAIETAWASPEMRDRYPIVQEIDQDIRARFGFGKYGLISADTAKEDRPYCQIATKRWLNDWNATFTDEVARHLKSISPDLLLISDDPQGQVFAYDYGRRWRNVDMVMHQTADKAVKADLGSGVIQKMVTDLVGPGKAYWPCIHFEGALALYDLEEMREIMSRAFRNGATGVTTYNLNWGGRIRGTEDMLAPERWAYINQIADFYAAGHRARIPEQPKVAALFSSYSAMADYARGMGGVYSLLGPDSGAYFRFVDSLAVDRGEADLSTYPVVFAFAAPYESPRVVDHLVEAVRDQGVTLVVTEPDAFRLGADGSINAGRETLLAGATFGEQQPARIERGPDADGALAQIGSMQLHRGGLAIVPGAHTRVLLSYANGQPACTETTLGKGRVIWFGFNPFHGTISTIRPDDPSGFDFGQEAIADPLLFEAGAAAHFFRLFMTYLDVPTDEAIWRLKLPAPVTPTAPVDGFCLTGNAVVWRLSRPHSSINVPMMGRYHYSHPPMEEGDAQEDGWIPFRSGRLTDRPAAVRDVMASRNGIATWTNTAPLSVRVDLGYRARIAKVDLYVGTAVPSLNLLLSEDGISWTSAGEHAALPEARGVTRIRFEGKDASARYVRIDAAARPTGQRLTLAELDVWGQVD